MLRLEDLAQLVQQFLGAGCWFLRDGCSFELAGDPIGPILAVADRLVRYWPSAYLRKFRQDGEGEYYTANLPDKIPLGDNTTPMISPKVNT